MKRKKLFKIIAVSLLIVFSIIAVVHVTPYFMEMLKDETMQIEFTNKIKSLGITGFFILLFIQVLQVVVAIIPGEPIEIVAGLCYGTFSGLLMCIIGILIGSTIIFHTVRKYGYPFLVKIFGEEKLNKFKFLNSEKKLETVIFILFLIPGTPKDILTYLAGITKISFVKFLVLSSVARIPSIVSSTLLGNSLITGNFSTALFVLLGTAIFGIVGIYINNKFINRKNQRLKEKKEVN